MKILHVTGSFYPSLAGMETFALNLSQALSQRGHDVKVLTLNTENVQKEEIITGNIKVYRCTINAGYHKGFISTELIRELLQSIGYDIYLVQVPFPFGLEVAIAASKIHKIPLVAVHQGEGNRGNFLYSVISGLYWKFSHSVSLRAVDRLIFLTRSYPDSLCLSNKVQEKIRIIRPGVDNLAFSPGVNGSHIRKDLGLGDNDKVFLFVGALGKYNRYKGVDYLLRALHLVKKTNALVKLVIVGGGILVQELKELAYNLDLVREVRFVGSVPHLQLPAYYAMADAFVLPSISGPEACPYVVIEAMASGKPSIISDMPGLRDNIRNGVTGFLISPRDVNALAAAIICFSDNGKLAEEMGKNARKDAELCTWDNCAAAIESICKELPIARRSRNLFDHFI